MANQTVLRLFGGDLGNSEARIRCNLAEASTIVEVDWCEGEGWQETQYNCDLVGRTVEGLVALAEGICGESIPSDEREGVNWEVLE